MKHETDGWMIGDKVYYFDTRNTTKHSVAQIMFCCGKVDSITAHNIYTDSGAFLLPGQYYRTLDELKNAVLKQIDEEVLCWGLISSIKDWKKYMKERYNKSK